MKTSALLLLALIQLVLFSASPLKAQENFNTNDNYYYNNFDSGALGSKISQSAYQSLTVSNSSPLSGTHSLSSTAGTSTNSVGGLQFSFLTNGTNLNAADFGYEWTFIYRNNGNNTDDSKAIDNGENAWKYWLFANNTDPSDMRGFYLTQNGSTMELRVRKSSNDERTLISYNLNSIGGNNTTYAIRIQRIKRGNQYVWQLFVDPYSSSKLEASTPRGGLNYEADLYNSYNYSALWVSSTSVDRFKFDELKTYSMKLLISGANDASYGVSNPLYAGQQNAVIYGLRMKTRGLFDFYQFIIDNSGNISGVIQSNSMKLNRSRDDLFGNADDSFVANLDFWNGRAQLNNNLSTPQIVYSLGTANGDLAVAAYFYISANVLDPVASSATFSFTSSLKIVGSSSQYNYADDSEVTKDISSPPTASGKVYDWIGVSNAWTTSSNWSPNGNPGANDLVRIGVAQPFTHQPTVSSGSPVIGNLNIGGNQSSSTIPTLTINGAATSLTINGAFTNSRESKVSGEGSLLINGNWTTSGGKTDLTTGSVTVNFTGAKAQSIIDNGSNSGNGVTFGNVGFSGGGTKTFSGTGKFAIAVNKYLTMGANTILDAAGLLTLKSDALGSAMVAQIPASSSIRGQVTVEKYIQGGRKNMWRTNRFFSSPIYDNTSSFTTTGARSYSFNQFIDDMLITGLGGAENGFDVNEKNEASAWTYNGTLNQITNINTSLEVGRGAYVYYRGNRTNPTNKLNAPYVDAESISMTFKGGLNQQDVTVPISGNNILGNPYAAVIDWKAVTKSTNVGAVIKIWNPKNRQFSVYNGDEGINDGSRYIAPGQGFTVQLTNASSGYVTFTEASKVSSVIIPTTNYSKSMSVKDKNVTATTMEGNNVTMAEDAASKVRVLLSRNNTENSDETLIVMRRDELATVAGYDVPRAGGEEVFLSSLSSEGRKMAINYMPHISEISAIKLGVDVNNNGAYSMLLTSSDVPVGFEAKLKDRYLNTTTTISDRGTTYTFSVDKSVAATSGSERFEILVAPVTTLPVVWDGFSGSRTTTGVLLNWKTTSETDNSYFEVFSAGENQIFMSIGTVSASEKGAYSLIDKTPLIGNNYYKLTQVDKNGKSTTYPNLAVVKYDLNTSTSNAFVVYPTLVESTFILKYNGSLNG
ncbi:MAG: hypothetical protein EOO42_01585, partial [Flavobacteriales bacterium]